MSTSTMEKMNTAAMARQRSDIYGLLAMVYRQEVNSEFLEQIKDPRFLGVLSDLGIQFDDDFLQKPEKELLEDLYLNQGLSVRECAEKLGLPSHGGISWRLKKFGIKTRPNRFKKGNQINKGRRHFGGENANWKGGKKELLICIDCKK